MKVKFIVPSIYKTRWNDPNMLDPSQTKAMIDILPEIATILIPEPFEIGYTRMLSGAILNISSFEDIKLITLIATEVILKQDSYHGILSIRLKF